MRDFQNSKILFKVSGSFEIGLGHVRRSLSLTQELIRFVGPDNIFLFSRSDIRSLLQVSSYPFVFRFEKNDDLINCIKKEGVEIVIFDEVADNLETSKNIKQAFPKVIIIGLDYFNYHNPCIDIIIDLFNQNSDVIYPQDEFHGQYYEGLAYAIIRESFIPYQKRRKVVRPIVEDILITFGGADHNNHTLKVLIMLEAIGYKGKVNIILGPFFQHKRDICEYINRVGYQAFVHNTIDNMEEFIFEADLGFIGAGTTMMEFCHLGTPAVVIPQNQKEYQFAQSLKKQKAVHILEDTHNSLIFDILFNEKTRQETSRIAQSLVDGKGKERIRDIILGSHLCQK